MRKDDQHKSKAFKRFKSGDGTALHDLLEAERPHLYDYLMRMTSQVSRSAECINEVFESLSEDILESMHGLNELRLCLYTTARRFNGDIWNAETSRLSNAALVGGDGKPIPGANSGRAVQLMDYALRSLPGPEREVVWLHIVGGFTFEDIAQITSLSEHAAESIFLRGVGAIDAEAEEICGPAHRALLSLPPHPLPPPMSNATVNLSMVMAGIKTKPVGLWSLQAVYIPLLILTLFIAWWITPTATFKSFIATWLPFLPKF